MFYLDKNYKPVAEVGRIAPPSDGVKAILAMYALQNGAGCEGGGEYYRCVLTDVLNIGGQCSGQHLELVRSWFKNGMPKMSGYADRLYVELDKDLATICYTAPDTASFQQVWDLIRVTIKDGRVMVYAHGSWIAREESGSFSYISEYEMKSDSIVIISHKKRLR